MAKKTHNAINIITSISVGLVAVGTMALIIILSVFNGLEGVINKLNSSTNTDLLIEPKLSKYIDVKEFPIKEIGNIYEIKYVVKILEDNVLFKYTPAGEEESPREFIGKLKGVDSNYIQATKVKDMMVDGSFIFKRQNMDYCVLGNDIAAVLQINLKDFDNPIHCYFPKKDANITINPLEAISIENIMPAGVFSIQQENDDKMIITSLDFAQKLMCLENKITSVNIAVKNENDASKVQKELTKILGEKYYVKNKLEQNAVVYNIMKSEKWSSFMILSFILFIATFNLVGALSVLIIDKQSDIKNLSFMGANKKFITKIFIYEGFLVTFGGTFLGLLLGSLLVLIQGTYHIIPMEGSFVINYFPVELRINDILVVLSVVVFVSMIAILFPIKRLSKTILKTIDNKS